MSRMFRILRNLGCLGWDAWDVYAATSIKTSSTGPDPPTANGLDVQKLCEVAGKKAPGGPTREKIKHVF